MRTIAAIAIILITSSGANAGMCEDEMASYNRRIAEDAAVTNWGPGVKEANDKLNARMKANILKGCADGAYARLDTVIDGIKEVCTAFPKAQGC